MPEIKDFTPRLYQETILHTAITKNTLVVLPTGLGKTGISLLLVIHRLNNFPSSKALLLAPTKPLCEQHYKTFKKHTNLGDNEVVLFTGAISPIKREELLKNAKIIISTPQTISNDIINNKIDLENISVLVLDEVHRSTGEYDYVWVAKQFNKRSKYPRILGLTASPGSDLEKIREICKNAHIEEIEIRTENDPDVKPYIQDIDVEWIKLDLPQDFLETKKFLEESLKTKLQKLKDFGLVKSIDINSISKKDLLGIQAQLQGMVARGDKDFSMWTSLSILAEIMKVHHALILLETQGIKPLYIYMKNIFHEAEKGKTKAVKNLVRDLNFKSAFIKTQNLYENNIDHPKLSKLKEIIKEEISKNKEIKIIVFNQFRESALDLETELNKIENVKAKLFVGQLKKGLTGLSQKEQIKILEDFKSGIYNIIISTSIGEEGLDIPKVDLVIFFEPIPSAIRSIQRRGRTARHEEGRLIILMTKNTRDEVNHWIAQNKEKKMYELLKTLKSRLSLEKNPVTKQEIKSDVTIYADYREKGSGIVKELVNEGINVQMKSLASSDYILSDRVGVELKTKQDFVNSIVDGRLLSQIKDLRQNFHIPILIIEGEEDIYSIRKVHPNAIRGMLATIAVSYSIPVLYTKNFQDTAMLLKAIASREQRKDDKEITLRTERKPLTTKEQQEFIIESLPGVGPSLAKSLLSQFDTVTNIINADKNALQEIEQLGPKKAEEIRRILEEKYPKEG